MISAFRKNRVPVLISAAMMVFLMVFFCFSAYSEENISAEEDFIFKTFDDHAEIYGYLGAQQTVVVPAEIHGKPVTVVKLGKSDWDNIPGFFPYIKRIDLPDTVRKLDDYCFGGLIILEEVTGLENVEEIGHAIFDNTFLKTATFSDNLRTADSSAFFGNDMHMEDLTIPDDLAFDTAHGASFPRSLQSLHLVRGKNEPRLRISDDVLFSADMSRLICVLPYRTTPFYEIPEGTVALSSSALYYNENVMEYQFPESLTNIFEMILTRSDIIMDVYRDSPAHSYLLDRNGKDGLSVIIRVLGDGGEQSIQEISQKIVSDCITDTMTDYQKARALHDWICDHTTYDYSLSKYGARDVLTDGTGVCEAYARAYSMLLSSVGIENRTIVCSLDYSSHMINAIKLNGKWYLVDCTNDDEGFGAPDELFCFNSDVFNQFYRGQLPIEADDLSLYAPFVQGRLDQPKAILESIISQKTQSGLSSFTVDNNEQLDVGKIPGSALCSLINKMKWTINGNEYGIICTTENGRIYSCSVVSGTSFAIEEDQDGIWLKRYNGNESTVRVPSEINGKPVVGLKDAFKDNTVIREVILPEGITEIGDHAFSQCTSLEKVNFPSSLRRIGFEAFVYCTSLGRSIVLPSGLEEIGSCAFALCISLESVRIPGTIEKFGVEWFYGCLKLKNVTIDDNLSELPEAAFVNCSNLKYIRLPKHLKTIRSSVFIRSSIVSLNIPASVSQIEWGAFLQTEKLETVTVAPDNPIYASQDNILFSKDMSRLIMTMGKIPSCYTVPDSVNRICRCAFALNDNLIKVNIPSSVLIIEDGAFDQSAVEEVYIEDGLTEIGEYAFASIDVGTLYYDRVSDSSSLKKIRLPNTLKSIGTGALFGNTMLEDLVLPASLKSVNTWFINYPQCLYIPEEIDYIAPQTMKDWITENEIHGKTGTYAEQYASEHGYRFVDESSKISIVPREISLLPSEECDLQVVLLDGNDTEISANQLTWENSNDCVTVSNGTVHANQYGDAVITGSYQGMSGSVSIHIYRISETVPPSIEIIGDTEILRVGEGRQACFYIHEPLQEDDKGWDVTWVEVNDHVQWSISNPDVLSVNKYAYINAIGPGECDLIAVMPDGTEYRHTFTVVGKSFDPGVDPYVLDRLNWIMYMPAGIKIIEDEAFEDCSFEGVIIPEGCTEIGTKAFSGNSKLQAAVVPSSIQTIADDAFSNCPHIILIVGNQYAEQYAKSHSIPYIIEY